MASEPAASKQVCRECGEPAQVEGEGSVYCWQHRPMTYSLLDWPSGAKVPEGSIIWHLCPNGLHLGTVEDCLEKSVNTSGVPVNTSPLRHVPDGDGGYLCECPDNECCPEDR